MPDAPHPEFLRGAWFAWDEVLSWINTQTEQSVDKATLYKQVMALRPHALHQEVERRRAHAKIAINCK